MDGWRTVCLIHVLRHQTLITIGILVAIDFILAILPLHLIRTLNRPIGEKILIGFLMSLGLIAGAIAGYRMSISNATFSGDLLSTTVMMSLWCMLEVLLGIMAACMARLKAPAEQFLRRLGFLGTSEMTRPSFVKSVPDEEFSHPADRLDLPEFPHTDGESEKESRNNKSIASTRDGGGSVHWLQCFLGSHFSSIRICLITTTSNNFQYGRYIGFQGPEDLIHSPRYGYIIRQHLIHDAFPKADYYQKDAFFLLKLMLKSWSTVRLI